MLKSWHKEALAVVVVIFVPLFLYWYTCITVASNDFADVMNKIYSIVK